MLEVLGGMGSREFSLALFWVELSRHRHQRSFLVFMAELQLLQEVTDPSVH